MLPLPTPNIAEAPNRAKPNHFYKSSCFPHGPFLGHRNWGTRPRCGRTGQLHPDGWHRPGSCTITSSNRPCSLSSETGQWKRIGIWQASQIGQLHRTPMPCQHCHCPDQIMPPVAGPFRMQSMGVFECDYHYHSTATTSSSASSEFFLIRKLYICSLLLQTGPGTLSSRRIRVFSSLESPTRTSPLEQRRQKL